MNFQREAERLAGGAWRRYADHCRRCPACTRVDAPAGTPRVRCSIGQVLREAWMTLDDLEADARWPMAIAQVVTAIGGGS